MNKVEKAQKFAHEAHDSISQKRKYGGEPYWKHTDAVAWLVSLFTKDENVIAAAHVHDVVEDVDQKGFDIISIALKLGGPVAFLTRELTDVYTHKSFPTIKRKHRKYLEAVRLSTISDDAKLIKLADLVHNSLSIIWRDRGFARIYLREKEEALTQIRKTGVPNNARVLFWVAKIQVFLGKAWIKLMGV